MTEWFIANLLVPYKKKNIKDREMTKCHTDMNQFDEAESTVILTDMDHSAATKSKVYLKQYEPIYHSVDHK